MTREKLEQHDWEIKNEDEIIDRFLEDYEDALIDDVRQWLKQWYVPHKGDQSMRNYMKSQAAGMFEESKDAQYALYLDTEEHDDTKEGCTWSEGER